MIQLLFWWTIQCGIHVALPYTEYLLRILKFEIRVEITEYDANGRGGACTKLCLCESVKNACGSLQMKRMCSECVANACRILFIFYSFANMVANNINVKRNHPQCQEA